MFSNLFEEELKNRVKVGSGTAKLSSNNFAAYPYINIWSNVGGKDVLPIAIYKINTSHMILTGKKTVYVTFGTHEGRKKNYTLYPQTGQYGKTRHGRYSLAKNIHKYAIEKIKAGPRKEKSPFAH